METAPESAESSAPQSPAPAPAAAAESTAAAPAAAGKGKEAKKPRFGTLRRGTQSTRNVSDESSTGAPASAAGTTTGATGPGNGATATAEVDLTELVLPDLGVGAVTRESLKDGVMPLLVFVNSKSGGQQGERILKTMAQLLSPQQVFDLNASDPRVPLGRLRPILSHCRVLVCGGDGTVGWLLYALKSVFADVEAAAADEAARLAMYPPIAILPLGTGNDLSRALGFGPGYTDSTKLNKILGKLLHKHCSQEMVLDRWQIGIADALPNNSGNNNSGSNGKAAVQYGETHFAYAMNNYMSVGVDAAVAMDFHQTRQEHPNWFKTRVGNKIHYSVLGSKRQLQGSTKLAKVLALYVDDKRVDIPASAEGIIVLNINNYMGGTNLWGHPKSKPIAGSPHGSPQASPSTPSHLPHDNSGEAGKDEVPAVKKEEQSEISNSNHQPSHYEPQRLDDGLLEICSVSSSMQMGMIKTHLASAHRITQGSKVVFEILDDGAGPVPFQYDGEPWSQPPARVVVEKYGRARFVVGPAMLVTSTGASKDAAAAAADAPGADEHVVADAFTRLPLHFAWPAADLPPVAFPEKQK